MKLDQKQSVSVYPNPSSGAIFIRGLDINENNLKIEWYDISGRLITQEAIPVQNGVAKLTAQFNNGVYLLRFISSDGSIYNQRVIIRN